MSEPTKTLRSHLCGQWFEAGRDFFGTSLHRTLSTVFKQVVVHAAPGTEQRDWFL